MFVDDFFGVDRVGEAKHAMNLFARLVRCLLGEDAISQRKLEHGNPLVVLGVAVAVSPSGLTMQPDAAKCQKWSEAIKSALETGTLCTYASCSDMLATLLHRPLACRGSLQACRPSHMG